MKKIIVIVVTLGVVLGLVSIQSAMANGYDSMTDRCKAMMENTDPPPNWEYDPSWVYDNLGDCVSGFTCSDFTSDLCRYWKDNDGLPYVRGFFGEATGGWRGDAFKNQGACIAQMKIDFRRTLRFLGCDDYCR